MSNHRVTNSSGTPLEGAAQGPKLTAEGVSVLKAIKMLQAGAIEGTPINKRPQGLKYSKFDGIKFELKGIDPNILTDVENLYQGQMSLSKLLPELLNLAEVGVREVYSVQEIRHEETLWNKAPVNTRESAYVLEAKEEENDISAPKCEFMSNSQGANDRTRTKASQFATDASRSSLDFANDGPTMYSPSLKRERSVVHNYEDMIEREYPATRSTYPNVGHVRQGIRPPQYSQERCVEGSKRGRQHVAGRDSAHTRRSASPLRRDANRSDDRRSLRCWECKEIGHYAWECPSRR